MQPIIQVPSVTIKVESVVSLVDEQFIGGLALHPDDGVKDLLGPWVTKLDVSIDTSLDRTSRVPEVAHLHDDLCDEHSPAFTYQGSVINLLWLHPSTRSRCVLLARCTNKCPNSVLPTTGPEVMFELP